MQELNEPERIVTLYTGLVQRFPDIEKLKRELFFGHVRQRNYRQQQQVAMQLYKVFNFRILFLNVPGIKQFPIFVLGRHEHFDAGSRRSQQETG